MKPHMPGQASSPVLFHGLVWSSEMSVNHARRSRRSQSAGPQALWHQPSATPADISAARLQAQPAEGAGVLGDSDCETACLI